MEKSDNLNGKKLRESRTREEGGMRKMNSMKSEKNGKIWFLKGMKHGIPIGLGYFAVSFTLGIASKKAGLSAFQAAVMSAAMMASAGQFAGIGMIAAGAGYLEMAVTTLVVNMRYLLMSSALSQKVRRDVPYEVTDEIFGIAVSVPEKLHPAYMYGAVAVAGPGWVLGTFLGAVIGMILPERVMSALNVALYGMFMAVVIPPSRKNRVIAGVVAVSMICSTMFSIIPGIREISSGFQMILLTVLLAGGAAVLFPVKEEKEDTDYER